MTPTVELSGITKSFRRGALTTTVLHTVSCSFAAQEFVALWGPSGSGKSTLLNIIGLCSRPEAGSVSLHGEPIHFERGESYLAAVRRTEIGYVFQQFNLLPSLTAAENVMVPLLLKGVDRRSARESAVAALIAVGLGEKVDREPEALSGGEMQRVAVARAVVHQPAVILADEPTGNLDSKSGELVLELLRGLTRRGHTVIMATHSEHARSYCDRTIHLQDGVVVTS